MPKKLSPENEIIAAHIAATTAAFQVLVMCLQENGALGQGQIQAALAGYIEMDKQGRGNEIKLALLDDLLQALSSASSRSWKADVKRGRSETR
jgi:hypothetical protein